MQWNRTYGNGDAAAIVQTDDDGFVLCCKIASFGLTASENGFPQNMAYDAIALVKTDSSGTLLWSQIIFEVPVYTITVTSMVKASDGGYAVAGFIASNASLFQRSDFLFIKADSQGKFEWFKTFGGAGADEARSLIQTSDGGYALAGYTSSYGPYNNNYWLVKTDSVGNLQWARAYGKAGLGQKVGGGYGSGMDYGFGDNKCYSVVQTSDGGYALVGYAGFSGGDYAWLVKTDSSGNALWNQSYGASEGGTFAYSVIQTGDGGFAIAASNRTNLTNGAYQIVLTKTDSTGRLQWEQTFQNPQSVFLNEANLDPVTILQTSDGALAILATAGSTEPGMTPYFYIVKTLPFLPPPLPIPYSTYLPPAEPTTLSFPVITIEADGNISPPTAPLTKNGNVYTFTSTFFGSLVVAKNNIVIDGSGYSLQGNGSITESDGTATFIQFTETGILLNNSQNVEIKNLTLVSYFSDILFNGSCAYNSIKDNTFSGIGAGIRSFTNLTDSRIVGNIFQGLDYALLILGSKNNAVYGNIITGRSNGIVIIEGSNDIIQQNTIDTEGAMDGIRLTSCSDYQIVGNWIKGTGTAISGATASTISQNTLIGNGCGMASIANSTIFENIIKDNDFGLGRGVSQNFIYLNNFVGNKDQTGYYEYRVGRVGIPANRWDNGAKGNFWSDYNGTDENQDGIGDTTFVIDENNRDFYPLMSQVSILAPTQTSTLPVTIQVPVDSMPAQMVQSTQTLAPAQTGKNQSPFLSETAPWIILPLLAVVIVAVFWRKRKHN